jgi:FkbM family methyltransferase
MQEELMKSWTLSFFRKWIPRMTLASAFRLRGYLLRLQAGMARPDAILVLHMKRPFQGKIALREIGSDLATFDEIMVDEVYRQVVRSIVRFQTAIDLGANIGLASLYLAHHSSSCRILAVEPNPKSYEMLVCNVRNLGERCRTLSAAVWGTHGRLLPDPRIPMDRFSAFTLRESSPNAPREMSVEGFTMPEILNYSGFDTVDLVKVDIEGSEIHLFREGNLQWLTRVGSIAIEFHNNSRQTCNFDDVVKSYGFEICSEERHTVVAVKPSWYFGGTARQS